MLPTEPDGLQQLPLNPRLHLGDFAVDTLQAEADSTVVEACRRLWGERHPSEKGLEINFKKDFPMRVV